MLFPSNEVSSKKKLLAKTLASGKKATIVDFSTSEVFML